MAAAIYFTYHPTTYVVNSVHPTQAEANTAASGDADKTAYVGAIDAINVETDGRWYYHDTSPFLRQEPRSESATKLQQVAWNAYFWLRTQAGLARELIGLYPSEDIHLVDDLEYWVQEGLSAVLEGRMHARYVSGVSTRITTAQKIAFCTELVKGSSDYTNVYELLDGLPDIRTGVANAGRELPPTAPFVWVDPRTGTRVPALSAVVMSGPDAGGAENLNLVVRSGGRVADSRRMIRTGEWINDLTG